jgi:hypothetical protein
MAAQDGARERRRTRSLDERKRIVEEGRRSWDFCGCGSAPAWAERESRFQMDTSLSRGLARSAARAGEGEAWRGRVAGYDGAGLRSGEAD